MDFQTIGMSQFQMKDDDTVFLAWLILVVVPSEATIELGYDSISSEIQTKAAPDEKKHISIKLWYLKLKKEYVGQQDVLLTRPYSPAEASAMVSVGLQAKYTKSSIRAIRALDFVRQLRAKGYREISEQVVACFEGKKGGSAVDNQVPKSLRARAKHLLR